MDNEIRLYFGLGDRATRLGFWLLDEVQSAKSYGVPYVFLANEIYMKDRGGDIYTEPALDLDAFKSLLREFSADYKLVVESQKGGVYKISVNSFDNAKFARASEERAKKKTQKA